MSPLEIKKELQTMLLQRWDAKKYTDELRVLAKRISISLKSEKE